MTTSQDVERNETMLKALIETSSIGTVASAFHNLFAHGEIFDEHGVDCTEDQLEAIFAGLDEILRVLKDLKA